MVSTFRGTLDFFNQIGIFDVVLPFLLVFTIVFAILEKTRVFGYDEIDGKKYPKKNLNSMAAFVIGFFVIASSRLVEIITNVSANVVVLLLASVLFLMLYGSFMKQTPEGTFLEGGMKTLFIVIMFVGLVLIFLNAIKTESGQTWLELGWNMLLNSWSNSISAGIFLVAFMIGAIYFVTRDTKNDKPGGTGGAEKREG